MTLHEGAGPVGVARLGVFGGTFDPPHVGHVVAASEARHQLGLDKVLMVVANRPWQKVGSRELTPAADRLAMAVAAVAGVSGVEVSSIEVDRGGPTYTIDTLTALADHHPATELVLILGADAAAGLEGWHRADEVRQRCRLAVLARAGAPATAPEGWEHDVVAMPRLDVSSTEVRRRVAEGRPIDGMVPPAVVRVLRERDLYAPPG